MMRPLDTRILDINSEAFGVSTAELMDNAGRALAEVVSDMYDGKKVLVVCGPGNNGGDGLAAAYHLENKATACLLFPPEWIKTEASRERLRMLKKKPKLFSDVKMEDYDVIVDCVLGTGSNREPTDEVAEYIIDVNTFIGHVISADVPTGFGTEKTVVPDVTVTFHDIKEGMNEINCGNIIVADIGIPDEAETFVGPGDMLRYPIPDEDSHKGQNGRLLIIGGGPYIGAPALAAMAAQRIGVDLVRIATPKKSFLQISSMSPNFITFELSGDVLNLDDLPTLTELAEKSDAVLIGPGLGTDERTIETVSAFVHSCNVPVVLDADAITALSKSLHFFKIPLVFTPHHHELERLLETYGALNAREFAMKRGENVVVVAKGKVDEITDGPNVRMNATGCAAMTVGGTGDALAGAIAGLLSKGVSAFDSGCLGAYICGKAGEYAFFDFSYGMMATDLIEYIPEVLNEHLR